jgi:hypothetical protein
MSLNPFHDLQSKRATRTPHIRLISEGGNSLARSPEPVCIESIQVSHTCTTESHHMAYRSTTGACSMFCLPDTSLFSVPFEQALQLDKGLIPGLLRSRFKQQALPLSDAARVDVHHPGRIWFINDQDRKYAVRKLGGRLTIYRDPR